MIKGATPAGEKKTVKILAVEDPASELYRGDGPVAQKWSEKTGISVKTDIVPWADYAPKVFKELDTGSNAYDAVMLPGFFWLPGMASKAQLCPLEDLLNSLKEEWASYNYYGILPSLREELFFSGRHYLIPAFSEIQVVLYRKDLIKPAGLGPLPQPLPLDLYIKTARALHKPPVNYGTHLKGGTAESFPEWLPFLSAHGGRLFGASEEPLFNSEAGRNSLRDLKDLLELCAPGAAESGNGEVNDLIKTGKVGIVNHWSGQLGLLMNNPETKRNGEWGYTYLENPWGTVWSFGINAAGINKKEALSYVLFATNEENDIKQGPLSGSPVRETSFRGASQPWYGAVLKALERKNSFPSFVNFSAMAGKLYGMVTDVLSGKSSIEEALAEAERGISL